MALPTRYAEPCASNANGQNPSRRERLVSVVGYSPAEPCEHPVIKRHLDLSP